MKERRVLLRRITDIRRKLAEEVQSSQRSEIATISSLAHAIETRDPYTRGHSERVGSYAVWIAKALDFPSKKIEILMLACRLHDIGKVSIPDSILLKPGKLTPEERAQIELHPVHSFEILKDLRFIRPGLLSILHHHERYDGRGYPHGLKAVGIPLEARILAVADAFDTMLSDRPYRRGLRLEDIIKEFRADRGRQFDPELANVFLDLIGRMADIRPEIDLTKIEVA